MFVWTSGRRIGNPPVVAVAATDTCSRLETPFQVEDMDETDGRVDRESGGEPGSEDAAAVCIVPNSVYKEGKEGKG